jgi:hypothetical protein
VGLENNTDMLYILLVCFPAKHQTLTINPKPVSSTNELRRPKPDVCMNVTRYEGSFVRPLCFKHCWVREEASKGYINNHTTMRSIYVHRSHQERFQRSKLQTNQRLTRSLLIHTHMRGQFAKFVDSPYYSESEHSGGAVPWQAMNFLQRSTHFSKTYCRPLITSKFLASELPFHGWKSPEIAWVRSELNSCVRLGKSGSLEPHQNIRHTVQISHHAISGLFQP